MIKKIFIFILIFIIIALSFLFFQKTNKYKLPKEYKIEIEKLIDEETPKTKIEIDKIFLEAQEKYIKVINSPQNMNLYMEFATNNYDSYIFTPEFYLYSDLIEITKKYTNIKDENIPSTDSSGELYNFLYPYFHNNNINTQKLDQLSELSIDRFKKIEHYYNNAHKIVYPDDNY